MHYEPKPNVKISTIIFPEKTCNLNPATPSLNSGNDSYLKGEALFAPCVATFHYTVLQSLICGVCVCVARCVQYSTFYMLPLFCVISTSYRDSKPAVPVYVYRPMPIRGCLLPVCDKDDCAGAR